MVVERNVAGEVRVGWLASLDLELAPGSPHPGAQSSRPRTVLARRAHEGPLVVQRPFYPEGDVCHVYLVHPPGGVVGGDTLELRVRAREGSHALITTPAATKFYRSEGRMARQTQDITIDSGAGVEWLPQETILFPDACATIATRVQLASAARFIGWEMVCYGRPASGLDFAAGRAAQDFEIWKDGAPLVLDHLRLHGAGEPMSASFGLGGRTVLGTLFAFPADDALVHAARAVSMEGVISACTQVDGVFVCRAVGGQGDAVRRLFVAIWSRLRPMLMAREAVAPRIWAT